MTDKREKRVEKLLDERKKLIGSRIKEKRAEANITQTELFTLLNNSEETDRGRSTISEYEHGKNITLKKVIEIANVLDCDVNYLLGCQIHPGITTSWISERIPLRRDAIESLERMKSNMDGWSDFEAAFLGYFILSDIIIHIENSLNPKLVDDKGELIEYDNFISNVGDMLDAYELISKKEPLPPINNKRNKTIKEMASDRATCRMQRLTIRGTSSWLGNDIAEIIRQSVKTYAESKSINEEEA